MCREKGWALDESIKPDSGVSAYKGDNLRRGFLGAFIAKVEREEVPTPCVLIVENWDRLTRQKLSRAQELLQELLKRGVSIYTANTGKLYDKSCLDDPMVLFQFLLEAQSAHLYSENISQRLKAAWKRKKEAVRAEGKLLTRRIPGWLNYDERSKKFFINQARANVVRRIFKMYVQGFGVDTIAKTLNQENVPTFSERSKESGWAQSSIRRFIRSVSVIGSYQPKRYEGNQTFNDGHEIEGYYPAILDKQTFFTAQQAIAGRRGIRGPKRSVMTLFTGLVRCEKCGSPVTIKAGKVSQKHNPWIGLVCRKALRGKGCQYCVLKMEPFESAMVTVLLPNILQHLYPVRKPEEFNKLVAQLEHVEKQIANTKADSQTLEKVPTALWEFLTKKEQERDNLKTQIEAMPSTDWYDYPYAKVTRYQQEPLEKNMENRLKVRAMLPSIIDYISLDVEKRRAKIVFRFWNPDKQEAFNKDTKRIAKRDGDAAALAWIKANIGNIAYTIEVAWPDANERDSNGQPYFFKNDEPTHYEDSVLWVSKSSKGNTLTAKV